MPTTKGIKMKNETRTIDRVTEYFGTAYKAAKALDVHHQQYYKWVSNGYIPFKRGKQVEELTNGVIKASDIWNDAGKAAILKE